MTAPTISASAIESFDPALGGCARKWAFSRLDGVPKPQSPGAALGSRCHELWESYLRDGTPFDLSTPEGRICDATRHLLPAPGYVDVETSFRFDWEGISWAGKKDAVFPDVGWGNMVVLDHKTTSDFSYAKTTREALIGHPQAPIYAEDEYVRGASAVTLAWNYVKHNVTFDRDAPPNAQGYTIKRAGRPVALEPPVRLIVGRAEAEDALGKHVPTAKRMLKIIAAPPAPVDGSIARALEPNPDACDAFGGCPYRAQCGLTPQEIAARITRSFATVEKEQAMGLRDRIAAIKAERSGPTQSSAIGVQQAIEAENAARAATLRGSTNQVTYGPVNPPEGSVARAPEGAPAPAAASAAAPTPLPPAEAPTRPDAPQATRRRGRPPGSKNKVKGEQEIVAENHAKNARAPGTHEILTYVPSAEECAAAEETAAFDATSPDTIPAPAIDDDMLEQISIRAGKRMTIRFLEALRDFAAAELEEANRAELAEKLRGAL